MPPSSAARAALRILAPPSPGAPGAGFRRAALVALMPRLLRQHHVMDLLEVLDGAAPTGAGADAGRIVAALRRRPTTCLYRSLAGFASLRAAGEPVRLVIGVRVEQGEVVAHAWLEQDGEPVGEPVGSPAALRRGPCLSAARARRIDDGGDHGAHPGEPRRDPDRDEGRDGAAARPPQQVLLHAERHRRGGVEAARRRGRRRRRARWPSASPATSRRPRWTWSSRTSRRCSPSWRPRGCVAEAAR